MANKNANDLKVLVKLKEPPADPYIAVHNGTFHCDDVLAVAMLGLLPQFAGLPVARTRDPSVLKGALVVADVGEVFDPAENRFDHHMKTFNETFSPKHTTCLSSAGCIWKFYGREIITALNGGAAFEQNVEDYLYTEIYQDFIEAIDAIDNGIPLSRANVVPPNHDSFNSLFPELSEERRLEVYQKLFGDTEPMVSALNVFSVHNSTSLAPRIAALNPPWNYELDYDEAPHFKEAVKFVCSDFKSVFDRHLHVLWPMINTVRTGIHSRLEFHASGRLMFLKNALPFQQTLETLEEELGLEGHLLFAIFPSWTANHFRVRAIGKKDTQFQNRLNLPKQFGGVSDVEEIFPGLVFVHKGLFIGETIGLDRAIALCELSLKEAGLF